MFLCILPSLAPVETVQHCWEGVSSGEMLPQLQHIPVADVPEMQLQVITMINSHDMPISMLDPFD